MLLETVIAVFTLGINANCSEVPFDANRSTLYTNAELNSVDPKTGESLDDRIIHYFQEPEKLAPSRENILKQRSHDAGVEKAMNTFLELDSTGKSKKKVVSIMGSSSLTRQDQWYSRTAFLTYKLMKAGYYVVSGGGAGLMEAAHLGSYMAAESAQYTEHDLEQALAILAETPLPPAGKKQFELPEFGPIAEKVIQKFPKGVGTLGIPVWFMGHERGNAFNGPIAKFLSNAIREEKITSIGVDGAIFLPGGPGTMKEVFMTSSNNTYRVYHWYSPMIFFDDSPEALAMQELVKKKASKAYLDKEMLLASKNVEEIIKFLSEKQPTDK